MDEQTESLRWVITTEPIKENQRTQIKRCYSLLPINQENLFRSDKKHRSTLCDFCLVVNI